MYNQQMYPAMPYQQYPGQQVPYNPNAPYQPYNPQMQGQYPTYVQSPIAYQNPAPQTLQESKPEETKDTTAKHEENALGVVNLGFFKSDAAASVPTGQQAKLEAVQPKKRATKKDGSIVVVDDNKELSMMESNTPFISTYTETNNLLKGSIAQADQMSAELQEDIDSIRSNKTLKSKYTYLTNLTATKSAILGTKIAAIRELNSSITNANNLDMKRFKDVQSQSASNQSDDARMMDMYNAFVNTPVGAYNPIAPPMSDIVTNGSPAVQGVDMVSASSGVSRTITPEQNRMRMENNPNIKTVVVYDQSTGKRFFDVIDTTNGQPVPNVPRPDPFLFNDMDINIRTGVARNRTMDITYPLILTGGNGDISEY